MTTKRKKWDRVEILWVDSYRTHGWLPLEEAHIEEDYCLDHRTIGYYLGETPRQISVCQSSKTHEELITEPETQIDAVMNIPKKAITKVIDLQPSDSDTNKRQAEAQL
jgi:hypothetical protein